jgi:hypothetical protein
MTEERAEQIATVLIGVAAAGAAFYILKTPSLRRMLWQVTRTMVTTTVPAWLAAEAERAWHASAHPGSQQQGV